MQPSKVSADSFCESCQRCLIIQKFCSELNCSHSKSVATTMMHRATSPGQKWNGRYIQRKDI
eukprot:1194531-Pleurochrysis_carterae.AAC.1